MYVSQGVEQSSPMIPVSHFVCAAGSCAAHQQGDFDAPVIPSVKDHAPATHRPEDRGSAGEGGLAGETDARLQLTPTHTVLCKYRA